MKLLLVDDEYSKVRAILEALIDAGIDGRNVEHVTTAHAARQALRVSDFDLVVIDLHLPDMVGASPSDEGGLSLFDMICLDSQVLLPEDVIFITAREELIGEIGDKVAARGAQLLQYRENAEDWKKVLVGRAKYVQQRKNRGLGNRVDVVIITALNRPELEAVLRLPYEWIESRLPRDPTLYHFGRILREDKEITVVAAHAQRKGMPSSAALAAKMMMLYRPRYLIMAGICAGVEGKVGLGDVVIGDPTWDWGSGKSSQDKSGSPVFLAAPYQHSVDPYVSQLATAMGNTSEIVRSISDGWTAKKPTNLFQVHVGPMASGASVIADGTTTAAITAQHRELIAIEMEAYAVMAAADYSPDPRPIALAIKSVCDFANPVKNDDWQDFAAYTSASFMDSLLRNPSLRFD